MTDLRTTTGLLQLFADPTRVRLMALLEHEELTVAELVEVVGLAQSRVSTHLGRLRDAGLLRDRRAGSSTYYRVRDDLPDAARLWRLLRTEVRDATLDADRRRAEALIRERSGRGEGTGWADSVAGQMERHYSPGRTWESYARAFLGLVRFGDVLDLGSGDGAIAELLAPRARSLTCVDRSPRVLAAARDRLSTVEGVRFVLADAAALPFAPGSFDEVLALNVLNSVGERVRVLGQAAPLLRPGGRMVVAAVAPHGHAEVTAGYGHRDSGVDPASLRQELEAAGLRVDHCGITSRERRRPHFEVVHAFAIRPLVDDGAVSVGAPAHRMATLPPLGREEHP
jgi:ArsR family transcriptional regulator